MRHNWITPRMGLFLAAAMLMPSLSALPPVSAAETAMTDDLLSVQGIPVEHTPEIALYGAGNTSPDEQAAYPEDIYSSTMGYDVLNDAQKSLYRKIKAAAHAFYTGTAAAEGVSYGSDEEKLPCFAIVSNTDSSLSNEDTVKVISMFRNDNPMYFFVGNNYLYSMDYDSETEENYVGAVYIACVEEYTSGTARQAERRALETQITAAREQVEAQDTAWEKARAANDWLCNSLTYAYDASGNPDDSMASHSIVGAFDERYCAAVCEGYAKAFQLLMNAAGVANAYIIGLGNGGGHAWNMAQMDDGYYYYFDVTWNDSTSSDKYFAAGETSFSKNHTPNTADGERWDYLYDLPDVPEDDGTDETGTVLTEGDFTYQLYTDHAVLTAYTGEDVFVSVPEEADGLPVTAIKGAFAGNTSVQLVDLPKTVTAVSYGTGGIGAFENCTALQAVSMILTSRVEYHSFRNCSALQTATLPQTVTLVGAGVFAACTSLNTLRVYSSDCTFGAASAVPAETVLYGYAGSTAQAYAKKYDRTFLSFGTVTTAATTAATETTTTTTQTTTTTRATTQTTSDSTTATTTATTVTAGEILLPEVGDCNNDGVCRVDDLVLLNQYLLGSVQGSEVQRPAMDCNADGTVDSRDSQLLAMFLMQLIPRLPA
ncbi:MAG: leucine-rich repeat protein [Ruminococcus callidus]|uniref:dockerin type I domain-containing protein n=1 Tax=Ruminococcus callidus TaxID=40519 RepID=UPI002E794BE5|nr:dockerin type I domain-containing protein [Ruminococcus callidus]MEE0506601.1 leucine-rich repeat protein [Ruminococcus callidus]